jgi:MFS family permease
MTSAQSLAGGIFGATYMLFCLKVVGLGPALLGLAIAMGGVGALAGSVLAGWLSRRFGVGPSILGAQALFGVVGALIAVTPAEPKSGLAFLMVSQFLGDAVAVAGMILGGSLRQTVLPTEVLGRVGATFKAAGGGFAIVGALLGGVLGEALGIRGAIIVAAVGLAICPLFGLPSPLRRLREMPVGPA